MKRKTTKRTTGKAQPTSSVADNDDSGRSPKDASDQPLGPVPNSDNPSEPRAGGVGQFFKSSALANGSPANEFTYSVQEYAAAVESGNGFPQAIADAAGVCLPDAIVPYTKFAVGHFIEQMERMESLKNLFADPKEVALLIVQATILFENGYSTATAFVRNPAVVSGIRKLKAVHDTKRKDDKNRTKKPNEIRKERHEPKLKERQQRFREFRKQGISLTEAREKVAEEFGKSFTQISRDTRGLD